MVVVWDPLHAEAFRMSSMDLESLSKGDYHGEHIAGAGMRKQLLMNNDLHT